MSNSTIGIGSYLMTVTRDGILPELILPALLVVLVVILRIRLSKHSAPASGSALARYAETARSTAPTAVPSPRSVTVIDFSTARRRTNGFVPDDVVQY